MRDTAKTPVRGGEFWDTPWQRVHVEQTVRENPKGATEGFAGYIRRIAILSGLTADDTPRAIVKREPGQEG